MSNLEDVFLRINNEFAPDLFSDLPNVQGYNQSLNLDSDSDMGSKLEDSFGYLTDFE